MAQQFRDDLRRGEEISKPEALANPLERMGSAESILAIALFQRSLQQLKAVIPQKLGNKANDELGRHESGKHLVVVSTNFPVTLLN